MHVSLYSITRYRHLIPGLIFSLFCCIAGKAQDDRDYQPSDTAVYEEGVTEDEPFVRKWNWQEDSIINQRKIPAEKIRSMKEDDAFWYAEIVKKKEQKKNTRTYIPLGQRAWFKTLLWFLIIGSFAAFIIWFLVDSNVGLFRKKNIVIDNNEGELIPEDIFAINYQREIDKAAREGNYRLAVRLHFLQLLKSMADRNVIQYQQDKTNLDYLFQLQSTPHYTDFFRITRNYEFSWYGQFEVSPDAYRQIRKEVEQFEQRL